MLRNGDNNFFTFFLVSFCEWSLLPKYSLNTLFHVAAIHYLQLLQSLALWSGFQAIRIRLSSQLPFYWSNSNCVLPRSFKSSTEFFSNLCLQYHFLLVFKVFSFASPTRLHMSPVCTPPCIFDVVIRNDNWL